MAWLDILRNRQGLRDKREADALWQYHCLWETTTIGETGLEWVWLGHFHDERKVRLDHPSAHARLKRYALVDHWVGKLARHALPAMEEEPLIVERWAMLEHPAFWSELSLVAAWAKTKGYLFPWERALLAAARVGNVDVFAVAPEEKIRLCTRFLTHPDGGFVCHPRVGLWLRNKGFCSMQSLCYQIDSKVFSPLLRHADFAGCRASEPVEPAYVENWLLLLLGQYPLTPEQIVRVVGQTIFGFGFHVWEHYFSGACTPYTRSIDMPMLRAACAVVPTQHEQSNTLYRTVRLASVALQTVRTNADWQQSICNWEGELHPELMMLLSLQRPKDWFELYAMGKNALNMAQGTGGHVETFALPALDG